MSTIRWILVAVVLVFAGAACEEERVAVTEGVCSRLDACESDNDCTWGGCGFGICFNAEVDAPDETCDCEKPTQYSCGCVEGQCTWWTTQAEAAQQ